MLTRTLPLLLLLLLTTGCAHASPPIEIGPMPSNYDQLARDWLQQNLKDPDSLKLRSIGAPVKTENGWLVCVTYAAKNSYGAYNGFKTHPFYLRNGAVFDVADGRYDPISVAFACDKFVRPEAQP